MIWLWVGASQRLFFNQHHISFFFQKAEMLYVQFYNAKKKRFDLIVLQFTEKQIQLAVKQVFPFNCVLLSFELQRKDAA